MFRAWVCGIVPKFGGPDRLRMVAFALCAIVVAAVSFISYVSLRNSTSANQLVQHAQEVIYQIAGLDSLIDDAESNQRGYLLTGDEGFLQAYDDSVQDVARSMSSVRDLVADNADQIARLGTLEPLLRERLELLSANLKYRKSTGLAGLDPARLLRGRQLMKGIDLIIAAMLDAERQVLPIKSESAATEARVLDFVLLAGSIASILFIGGIFALVDLEVKRRRRAEGLLQASNAELEDRVASRTSQLDRSERQLRLLIDGAPAAIAMFDRDMRYLAVSKRFVEDLRVTEQDLIGRSHYEIFPEISQRWRDIHQRCLGGAVERCEEDPFLRSDGHTDWIRWEIRPWYDEKGVIGGIILFSEIITERKRVEEQRRVSEALYRQVVELSLDGIWIHSAGRIVFANGPAVRMFGFGRPEDLLGRSPFEIIHPDDRDRAMARTNAMNRDGKFAPLVEMKFLGQGGRTIMVEVQGRPFIYEGEPAIMVVGRDISERVVAAETLRESEARFQSLANTLPALMWMSGRTGECIFVNNSWLKYTGRSLEAELGDGYADRIYPDDRKGFTELHHTMIQSQQPVDSEYRLRDGDGRYRWFADYSVPRIGDDGRYLGHVGVLIDVNDRRRLEARMRTVVESAVDGIITINEVGTIQTFSGPAERIFGYRAVEVVGRNISMLMPEPDNSGHDSYLQNYLRTGVAKIIGIGREVRGLRKDGTAFPMDLAVGELPAVGGQREFVGTVRDISERRHLEHQLRQSQKMESIGQLTGGIAHDFNNLLGVVVGNLDILLEGVKGESDQGKLIGRALNSALHGAELTHRLLAFARQQQLEPKAFSINGMLPDVIAILRRTLGESIEVKVAADEDLWPAYADPSQVQDAIINLAINARDAMPDGGVLTIETANIHLDADYATDSPEAKPGDYAMLAVTDTGVGMPPEVAGHAMEPFFTTKPVGKGTGLGLSSIYGFARQSGGHLKIYSEVGHGTTVKLYLPRAKAGIATSDSMASEQQELPRGDEVILVAEDNTDLREMAVAHLSSLGYRVVEAKDGEAALATIMGSDPIDLLFSDIVMSGKLTGHDLFREAQKYRPGLAVLLTTGYAEKATSNGNEGERHVLRKPYRKRDLAFKVRSILDQR